MVIEIDRKTCNHCLEPLETDDTFVCPRCVDEEMKPYPFVTKAAAKSSSLSLQASVCQGCGCKLDGKAFKAGCKCTCHTKGVR